MLDTIISLYAPHQCFSCATEGTLLCPACLKALPAAAGRCYACRKLSPSGRTCEICRRNRKLYAVRAAAIYQGVAKDLVGRLKFSGARAAAEVMATALDGLELPKGALIVPVPTATGRVRLRGYDQAVLIAKVLARRQEVDYAYALYRTGQHRQVGASRAQRLDQMKRSFAVTDNKLIKNRHVILVDDVMTTGATLETAATALKESGAKRVEAVVFARA